MQAHDPMALALLRYAAGLVGLDPARVLLAPCPVLSIDSDGRGVLAVSVRLDVAQLREVLEVADRLRSGRMPTAMPEPHGYAD